MQKHQFSPVLLGYLGLIPFIVSSVLVWIPEYHHIATQSLTTYAAVIVTFIGGVHWGIAMQTLNAIDNDHHSVSTQFIFSIIPSLVAWIAVVMNQSYSLLIIAICFVLFWYIEKVFFNKTLKNWYRSLRTNLTFVATICIVIGWLGI